MASVPTVSVIVPAFNAEAFVGQAIGSILAQTFDDFELVVVDDGSTDRTAEVLSSIGDDRLHVRTLGTNSGLAAARNLGLAASRGKYIAWLDSDDSSSPSRLGRQVRLLEANPTVGVCGTWVRTFGDVPSRVWRYPRTAAYIRAHMLFDDPVATSSVMIRRDALEGSSVAFEASFAPAEDYDCWERISRSWGVVNIPRILTRYRIHGAQTSTRDAAEQRHAIERIQLRQLCALGLRPSEIDWRMQFAVGVDWGQGIGAEMLSRADSWLDQITDANAVSHVYSRESLAAVVAQRRRIVRNQVRPSPARSIFMRLHTLSH